MEACSFRFLRQQLIDFITYSLPGQIRLFHYFITELDYLHLSLLANHPYHAQARLAPAQALAHTDTPYHLTTHPIHHHELLLD